MPRKAKPTKGEQLEFDFFGRTTIREDIKTPHAFERNQLLKRILLLQRENADLRMKLRNRYIGDGAMPVAQ